MAKASYTKIKQKVNTSIESFDFNGETIEVLQYLPIDEKESLINVTLQESKVSGYYSPLKKDMYFHLNLVFLYSNINFTDKQREDLSKLYDELTSSGLLTEVIKRIPESEYELLYSYIQELEDKKSTYENTLSGVLHEVVENLPLRAEEMQNIVDNFDREKFQDALNFAKELNGGRELK